MTHTPPDPKNLAGAPGIRYRSVAYDVGSGFATGQGDLSRNVWSTSLMRAEVDLVCDGLNGNSINIYGTALDRLSETTAYAAERGLHVWLDPRLPDGRQDDTIDHLAEVARIGESFRKQGADIDVTVGGAHSILTSGIYPGEPYLQRIANIFFDGDGRFGLRTGKTMDEWLTPQVTANLTESAPRLNAFLRRAVGTVREIFHGRVGYSSTPWEQVDWEPFDLIGIEYFLMPSYMAPEQQLEFLARYRKWNKPVFICGFGTASYSGSEEKGFFSWDIVDRSTETLTIVDGPVRDEGVQAAYFTKMLGIFEQAGVVGTAPTDLVHPTHPHHPTDTRRDLDMASMSIVKCIRENYDDHNSEYRREPKESFHAIADFYARTAERQNRQAA
jgi:hypothetical protein